jgi:hypothetical protein
LWLADWETSQRSVLELIENTVFSVNSECEQAIRLAIKYGKSAPDLLSNYSPFKEKLERIHNQLEKEATAKQQVLDEASKTEQAKLDAARAPDAPLNDGEAATQVIGDGQDPGGQAADDDLEDLTTHEEIWRHYAKQQLPFFCNTVVWSEEMKAGDLVELLRKYAPATCQSADRGNAMILCDMNVWGAVGSRSIVRKSALAPEHLNTLVSAVLQCRNVDFEASVTYLPI